MVRQARARDPSGLIEQFKLQQQEFNFMLESKQALFCPCDAAYCAAPKRLTVLCCSSTPYRDMLPLASLKSIA